MKLYHYTCSHSVPGIEKDRWLRGREWPFAPEVGPLIHLTDLDLPERYGLGLTSQMLKCDRTEWRVTVSTTTAVHWPVFAREIPRAVRRNLESAAGALPMHWYVSRLPVGVFTVELVASLKTGATNATE